MRGRVLPNKSFTAKLSSKFSFSGNLGQHNSPLHCPELPRSSVEERMGAVKRQEVQVEGELEHNSGKAMLNFKRHGGSERSVGPQLQS